MDLPVTQTRPGPLTRSTRRRARRPAMAASLPPDIWGKLYSESRTCWHPRYWRPETLRLVCKVALAGIDAMCTWVSLESDLDVQPTHQEVLALLRRLPCLDDLSLGGRRKACLTRASAVARVIGDGWVVQSCSLIVGRNEEFEDFRDVSSVTSLNEFRVMVAEEPMDVLGAWIHLRPNSASQS